MRIAEEQLSQERQHKQKALVQELLIIAAQGREGSALGQTVRLNVQSAFAPAVASLASFQEEEDEEGESSIKLRYGACASQGARRTMEDVHVILDRDDLQDCLKGRRHGVEVSAPSAFFGVFDGHGGTYAAEYGSKHLVQALLDSEYFPHDLTAALRNACLTTDEKFYHEVRDKDLADSGSTVLAAVLAGQDLVVANAGDCRAVLSRRGKALELTRDHKPSCDIERERIQAAGGYVSPDGRLSGQLSVARALGDYGVEELGGRPNRWLKRPSDEPGPFRLVGPLTAEPEIRTHRLTPEDEFVVLACDGLWDVLSSQRCVELARQHLRDHNNPQLTAQFLVDTSFEKYATDNVTCLVVCFSEAPPPLRTSFRFGRTVSKNALASLSSALSASDLPSALVPGLAKAAAHQRVRDATPSP